MRYRRGRVPEILPMKFVSFRAGGAARYGLVDGNRVVDLTRRLKYPDLKSLITADAFAEAGREAKGAAADFALDQIAFDPVIPNPGKIICVGLNYQEHRNETGMTSSPAPRDVHPLGRYADGPPRPHGEATRFGAARLRGRAGRDHREGRPKHQRGRGRGAHLRLLLLQRRLDPRVSAACFAVDAGQELSWRPVRSGLSS